MCKLCCVSIVHRVAELVMPEQMETEELSETEQIKTEQDEDAEIAVEPMDEQPKPVVDESPRQEADAQAPADVQEEPQNPTSETAEAVAPALTVYDTGNESLNQLCDGIVYSIANDSMSQRDKARAVYDWVENNIRYSGTTPITDWITGGSPR
ncbi:hypothetical protein FYJ75_06935 [Roseburia sp. MUC/MUC-530-WT-4D]|uniref:Uncharacterized protein n=2 Tax=Roseburia porci TaxID=2605790 RepID=A0A6L5YR24_9FIRM|nr:hypothetical protein [Roseburia porci]